MYVHMAQPLHTASTHNFSKAVNPKKLAAAKTPTTSASLTFISLSFSYSAERARAKAAKESKEIVIHINYKFQIINKVVTVLLI